MTKAFHSELLHRLSVLEGVSVCGVETPGVPDAATNNEVAGEPRGAGTAWDNRVGSSQAGKDSMSSWVCRPGLGTLLGWQLLSLAHLLLELQQPGLCRLLNPLFQIFQPLQLHNLGATGHFASGRGSSALPVALCLWWC